nr:LptF/LptG family permease [Hufsiella ginkgonis]
MLVIKAFIRPFVVTFFIVMFVLLMLFLFKYIDDLIGKGFEWHVIVRLLWYASATNVAMALPLAMLLSSIMTFGSLGENYELVAIKSAGISLQRAMMPLLVLISLLSISAFFFSDYMLPKANLKMGSLLYDVRNQKAAFLIQEGVFNNSFAGYSIRVKKKDPAKQMLYDILIYDHNSTNGNISTLMAKKGKMYTTEDNQYLVLKLMDGVRYEEKSGEVNYNPRQRFIREKFKETEQKFDLSVFTMQHTDEGAFKTNYMMLNQKELRHFRDSAQKNLDSSYRTVYQLLRPGYVLFNSQQDRLKKVMQKQIRPYKQSVAELVPADLRSAAIQNASGEAASVAGTLAQKKVETEDFRTQIRRYIIEYQRKFTLAMSCLILFSIGAPLGAIIRKGGLGLPVVMSIIFFLIYHIISTIAEKSAKEGSIQPVLGMWLAIIILAPLGVFLTYKATVDSALFNVEVYKQFFQGLFKNKKAKV